MTDTTIPEAPKPKRKWPKRKPRLVVDNAPKAPAEFEGLTATDCCNDCDEHRCVISGAPVCAHPMKGGLQAAQQRVPEVVKRYRRAKIVLADERLDVRKMGGG